FGGGSSVCIDHPYIGIFLLEIQVCCTIWSTELRMEREVHCQPNGKAGRLQPFWSGKAVWKFRSIRDCLDLLGRSIRQEASGFCQLWEASLQLRNDGK